MYKILANDGISASAKEKLEKLGYQVDTSHYDGAELDQQIQEVDCIIIRSATKIREPLIDKALETGKLKVIIRAGVGIDNIDHVYAKEKGLSVRNTPNSSSAAVAELAIGHMFAVARNIFIANVTMREGKWNKKQYAGFELRGKTLGLVGFGRISQNVANIALALGMTVIYDDILGASSANLECEYVGKEKLLQESDIISLHIPFIKANGAYLGKPEFDAMKPGMVIINTARGGTVDEAALVEALDNGTVKFAALDVFEQEPTQNKAVFTHPKISLTPHIGAATKEAQDRIGEETISVILEELS